MLTAEGITDGLTHLLTVPEVAIRSGVTYLGETGYGAILAFLLSLTFKIGLIKFATKYKEGLVFKSGMCCLSSTPVAVFKLYPFYRSKSYEFGVI